jgi:hypothetical protein
MKTIDNILYDITSKQMVLPEFQREYVWTKEQAKQLLVSLYRGYPVGSLLVWKTENPPQIKNNAVDRQARGYTSVLLDGQQRLTTLYLFSKNQIPPYYNQDDITHDPRDLYFNLKTEEFRYYQKQLMEANPQWQKVTACLSPNGIDAYDVIDQMDVEDERSLNRTLSKNLRKIQAITNKTFPIQEVGHQATIDEAIDVFDRVNSQGTPLTDAELVLAHIAGKWPNVRQKIKDKQKVLQQTNFDFDLDFFTRCMVISVTGSALFNAMTYEVLNKQTEESYKQDWQQVAKVIDYLIPIAKESGFIDSSDDLRTNNVFIPLIAYLLKHESFPSQQLKNGFIYWLHLAHVWSRYSGQTDQRLDRDVFLATQKTDSIKNLVDELLDMKGRIELKASDLEGRGAGNPLHRLLYIVSKWRKAQDWQNGGSIRDTLGGYYSIQSHHIFPKSLLYDNLYDSDNHLERKKVNEIANRAFITRDSNYSISNKIPKDYLAEIDEQILASHCVPTDSHLWMLENYEDFLKARRKLLADAFNEFINHYYLQYKNNGGKDEEINFLDIINGGENNYVEFKSSLRWDYYRNQTNKDLKFEVLKTLVALMNTEGGWLFIGVKDDGEILGLANDYKTLGKNGDKDSFLTNLDSAIADYLGKETLDYIKAQIIKIDDKEICVVNVNEAAHEVYLEKKDEQVFYVRASASSQSLSIREAKEYIDSHWG